MSKTTLLSLVIVVCAWSCAAVSQSATINIPVPNGDFSSPAVSPGSYIGGVPTSWQTLGGDPYLCCNFEGMSDTDPFFYIGGFTNPDGVATVCFSQLLGEKYVVGDTYTLDFYYASVNSLGAESGGSITANLADTTGNIPFMAQTFAVGVNQGWTHASISDVAPAAAEDQFIHVVFRFDNPTGDNFPFYLDQVTLTRQSAEAPAVPEPATLVSLASGLVGLSVYVWRRQRVAMGR